MNVEEKRIRFELFLRQTGIPSDVAELFATDGYIDKVEVSRYRPEWRLHLMRNQVVPLPIYRIFCKSILDTYAETVRIYISFQYGDTVNNSMLLHEYWSLFLEWVEEQAPAINGYLRKARLEVDHKPVTVALPDSFSLERAKKNNVEQLVGQFFSQFFSRDLQVRLVTSELAAREYEQFSLKLQEEQRQAVKELLQASENRANQVVERQDPERKLMYGAEIREDAAAVQTIREEQKKVVVQGTMFGLEKRELKTGTALVTFNLTDYTDSIAVKLFIKQKEEWAKLDPLVDGMWVKARGKVEYDRYSDEPVLIFIPTDINEVTPPLERMDDAPAKRVEWHLHTTMSAMDGITAIDKFMETAAKWGHRAIAITDHHGVQAFPDAYHAAKQHGIKPIFGLEASIVNDSVPIVYHPADLPLRASTYVIFDIETTGLSVTDHNIIELAGVKMREGQVLERFSFFVNPHESIPYPITQLTSITNEMVEDAPDLADVLPTFLDFIDGSILVAHNARFDMGFMHEAVKAHLLPPIENPVIDTLELSRLLYPSLKNHRLNTLAVKFKISLDNHHRAVDDAQALGSILFHMLKDAEDRRIFSLAELNDYSGREVSGSRPFHCCLYARNLEGKKNLYTLVSLSHTVYLNKVPVIPKSVLAHHRSGLIVSSGCEKGELFETVLLRSREEAEQIAEFYDVLEIQPPELNLHLVDRGIVSSSAQLEKANRAICEIGEKQQKLVIATGNVHYLHPRDKICRDIIIQGITGFSPLKETRKPDAHLRTTGEMLTLFAHLGNDKAFETVVTNTNLLADSVEEFELFPNKTFFPVIPNAEHEIREQSYAKAKQMYGDPLPDLLTARLERELNPIIEFGFATLILISERLVKKSNSDGYLVGSRGSVGSSVVAMMLGISEVNPLPPHYLCTLCKHTEWFTDGTIASGYDLPDQPCPGCGRMMRGEGQDIPFETFMGFKGDKMPDIDLNFSSDYQPVAHQYTKVLFGEKNVFRAGTIGTVAEKTAFGYVKKYEEAAEKEWSTAEEARLANGCVGVRRSTGQHAGAIVVVPEGIDVEDVTPVQYPADDTKSEWQTTHFDFHAYDTNLLKLDILGHTDPTKMRMLDELTGIDPQTIPMNDPEVISLFHSTNALGVTREQIRTEVGAYGLPDFGSAFTRKMLAETKPKTFSDLLQISGLSHGTGVWLGNAQELIRNGTCTISTVIGCRDNIMLHLIYKGMDASLAFKITESVRKGKGLTDEWIADMKKVGVPDWYIQSCLKIEYMFPRAHAAAYCISAVRAAYYKLYRPIEFYATAFTIDGTEDFDVELCAQGYDAIRSRFVEIEEKGMQATPKEKALQGVLELALEMTARGFSFKGIDILRSEPTRFLVDGDSLLPPFSAIGGIGVTAAKHIAAAKEDGSFLSIEDFQQRSKASKSIVDILGAMGCFRGMPASNQLELF